METLQPCDKALKHGCFVTIKKLLDSLGKKWGHPKKVQKSDVLTTRGFDPMWNGLIYCERTPKYTADSDNINMYTQFPLVRNAVKS